MASTDGQLQSSKRHLPLWVRELALTKSERIEKIGRVQEIRTLAYYSIWTIWQDMITREQERKHSGQCYLAFLVTCNHNPSNVGTRNLRAHPAHRDSDTWEYWAPLVYIWHNTERRFKPWSPVDLQFSIGCVYNNKRTRRCAYLDFCKHESRNRHCKITGAGFPVYWIYGSAVNFNQDLSRFSLGLRVIRNHLKHWRWPSLLVDHCFHHSEAQLVLCFAVVQLSKTIEVFVGLQILDYKSLTRGIFLGLLKLELPEVAVLAPLAVECLRK